MTHTLALHRSRQASWLGAPVAPACQSTPHPTRGNVPAGPGVSAVAVAPSGLQWPDPDGRVLALSRRRVGAALTRAGEAALCFGASEVRVPRTGDARRALLGVRSGDVLMPRPPAERRFQASERELLDTPRQSMGQRTTEVVMYVGHEEVHHPAARDVVLEDFGGAPVNPDADTIDEGAAPAPELRLRRAALAREARSGVSGHPRPPCAPSVGTALTWAPWHALDLKPEFAARDAERLRHPRFAAPALPQTLARARLAPRPVEARAQQPSGRIVPLVLP